MAPNEFPSLGIAAAWGARPPGRRGPAPTLSINTIVGEAVTLADEGGVDAVTLPAVAARVGIATNSLYRYVASKDELLLLTFDRGVGEPPPAWQPEQHWRAIARMWLEGLVARYAARPWLLDVRLHGPPMLPNTIGWLDRFLEGLRDSPWEDGDALQLATLLDRLAHAIAFLHVGVIDPEADRPGPDELAGFLRTQTTAHGYTEVQRLIDRGVYTASTSALDLDRALDWVFGSVHSRTTDPG